MFDFKIDYKWSDVRLPVNMAKTIKPTKAKQDMLFDCGEKVRVCSKNDCEYAGQQQSIENFSYNNSKTETRKPHCKSCDKKIRDEHRRKMYTNKEPRWFSTKAYDLISRAKEQGIAYDNREKLASHLENIWPKDNCCVVSGKTFEYLDPKFGPSVDKIDPDKGYVEGNLRWVTKTCNSKKKDNKLENQLTKEIRTFKDKGVSELEMINYTNLVTQSLTHQISQQTGQSICFDAKKTTNRNIELLAKAAYKAKGEQE